MTFTHWLFPWTRGWCSDHSRSFKIHSNSLDHIPSGFTPGKIDWSLFPEYLCRFDKYLFQFATGKTQFFPSPPLWLLFITTLGIAVPLSRPGLWCNVNNMQKTVWSIPINAVTRLLWVFYCVVTCIVLSILSWKTSIEKLSYANSYSHSSFFLRSESSRWLLTSVTTQIPSKQV